jgi:hypothetical protein
MNRAVFIAEGLSPADISFFNIDPATALVSGSGDSPYHGDYSLSSPLYLTGDERLLVTRMGNYFRTDTLAYAGSLSGMDRGIHGFSHSAAAQEAVALAAMPSSSFNYPFPPDYPAAYRRYQGALLLLDQDLALPTINGAQAYGMKIFHSGNGSHVLIVQTGTAAQGGAGASFYVMVR